MTVTIGEAARRLGVRTSTLRYYEERGLVLPVGRQGGARRYGEAELRRVALIQICQETGMSLDDVRVLLAADRETWRAAVQEHLERLDARITALRTARESLAYAPRCAADHPATECPYLRATLDARIAK